VVILDSRLYETFVFYWTGVEFEWAFRNRGIERDVLEGEGGAALVFGEVETLGKWTIGCGGTAEQDGLVAA
jgi:hypothetical protein